jgi:hypothetical protein
MQEARVVENCAVSAHLQVELVRWSLAAVGEPEDRVRKRDPGDPLRRVAKVEPVSEVLARRDP